MDDLLKKGTKEVNLLLVGEPEESEETIVETFRGSPKAAMKTILKRCGFKSRNGAGVKALVNAFNRQNGWRGSYFHIVQLPLGAKPKKIT